MSENKLFYEDGG